MLSTRFAALALVGCGAAVATAMASDVDFSEFADRIDPIGCARVAVEAGDLALLAQLKAGGQREAQLVAVRAAPYAHAPEQLVVSLVDLACGRDPNLAPEAALSLIAIGERLTLRELSEREVLLADVGRAERRVTAGCGLDPEVDVLFALELAGQRLRALSEVPGP